MFENNTLEVVAIAAYCIRREKRNKHLLSVSSRLRLVYTSNFAVRFAVRFAVHFALRFAARL
jgi:hypothetical protein